MCTLHQIALENSGQADIPQIPSAGTTALKFWEIMEGFRCPVIGMCLTPGEQKQLLKKAGFSLKNKSSYDVHEILVAGALSENRLSQKVDRLLNRKFGKEAATLHMLPEQDFMRCWKSAFEGGQYLAQFWAAVSRRDLSCASKKEIFGAIHMAMHADAEQAAHAARRLAQIQIKLGEKDRKIKELNLQRRIIQRENNTLTRMFAEVNESLTHMLALTKSSLRGAEGDQNRQSSEPADMTTDRRVMELEQENQRLRATIDEHAARIESKDRKLQTLSERIARLSKALEDQKQTEALFRKEVQGTLHAFFKMNQCNEGCPAFDLCRKRVLIVGGIARMEALYRQLIENSGGFFEYHDGHMNGGAKQLENRLKRSDIVLCPVNCNSHAACTLVKNLGKKHNKPVHMLANFSLSAVSQAIRTCGGGQATGN